MNRLTVVAACTIGTFVLAACGGGSGSGSAPVTGAPTPAPQPPPPPTQFVDATSSSGIDYEIGYILPQGSAPLERIATGGGASGDYDGDGDVDLFITRGDGGPNLLYRNDGDLTFVNVSMNAGLAFTKTATENYRHGAPAFADVDGDGDLDLFIGGLFGDPSLLFENNGNGTFSDVTAGSGIDTITAEHNLSAAFGDYDLDGDVDLLLAHWGSTIWDSANPGDSEHLWRNDSDATGIRFTSVSESAEVAPSILSLPDPNVGRGQADWTFAPRFARINDDLYPDIVMAADYNYSQVFLNDQDGTFTNATDVNVIIDENGMGSALGDYDNDGDLDWFVTSIYGGGRPFREAQTIGNRLYRNTNGVFEDVTDQAGVADGSWGWGACFMDFENDGDLDIFHTNGFSDDTTPPEFGIDPNRAFVSNGLGSFEDRAIDLGLADREEGRGAICADFDEDGDIDILQLHRGSPVSATLWRNDTAGNNYLRVKLNGQPPNTEASGARIMVTIGSETQMREIMLGNNFQSQNPTVQVFGLGAASQVDELAVEWPDGSMTTMLNVAAGQTVIVNQ